MKKSCVLWGVSIMVLLLNCCKIGDQNPIPVLTSLSPGATVSHLPAFTLTVQGNGFVTGSKIVFDGKEKTTTFVNSTKITCQIEPGDTVVAGAVQQDDGIAFAQDQTVKVLVRNPLPGGGDSSAEDFDIYSDHTFQTTKNISNNVGRSSNPDIAADSAGNLYVVWEDNTSGAFRIFLATSSNYGHTWKSAINISAITGNSLTPAVAVNSSDHVWVVFAQFNALQKGIYFTRSTDRGVTWSTPAYVYNSFAWDCYNPDIVIDSAGNINAVWNYSAAGVDEIYFSRSTDNGANWSAPKNISGTSGWSWLPKIAVDSGGYLYTVWWDLTAGEEIYFSRSSDNGASWSLPKNLSNTPVGESTHPQIAVDKSRNIYVVWDDEFPHPDELMYFTKSTDSGVNWSSPLKISLYAPFDYGSALGVDTAVNINVTWKSNSGGMGEIFFSRSIDNGTSWSYPQEISNLTIAVLTSQAMAVDSAGNISVVFGASNNEIYFTSSAR